MNYQLLIGDNREVLRTLPAQSVHCVVTSPPYWGLRDYGAEGQLGLEETPEEYVANMVDVFREVWRVLRDDGVLWLNLGDSYNGSGGAGGDYGAGGLKEGQPRYPGRNVNNLKPKDLVGIPWRVAFALQADGWYLRSDVIWHKPNPMPESVTDRPTKAHEYIFLLTKSARYFYDADAVAEKSVDTWSFGQQRRVQRVLAGGGALSGGMGDGVSGGTTRNRRSVWTIATQPYSGAHFATFSPKLIEPCVLAGTSARGCCPTCGAPWERIIERTGHVNKREAAHAPNNCQTKTDSTGWAPLTKATNEWQPTCTCPLAEPVSCTVLDPFNGAGTTGVVAGTHGRDYIGIELNPDYLAMADKRIGDVYRVGNLEWLTVTDNSTHEDLPLFAP
jgi:DNA modification methylase